MVFKKGFTPWNKNKKMSAEHCNKLREAHPHLTGKKSPHWKGGKEKNNCSQCKKTRLTNPYRKLKTSLCKSCYHKENKGNPLLTNTYWSRRRRAREMGAEGNHSPEEWEQLKKDYGFMCLCCKKQEPLIKLTQDHIIPLSKGGTHFINNIQPLCMECNLRKWNNVIDYRSTTAQNYA